MKKKPKVNEEESRAPSEGRKRRLWLIEAWERVRENFITLMGHALLLAILPLLIAFFHFFFKLINLPDVYLKIVQFFELVGSVAAFAIFTMGFIMELITLLWRKYHGNGKEPHSPNDVASDLDVRVIKSGRRE
ncbi:MAG: hypothetical protein MOB07_07650 [Acidobacteria bacterium]|nr:hypothetical protein [Acidobacteriota bacterium]